MDSWKTRTNIDALREAHDSFTLHHGRYPIFLSNWDVDAEFFPDSSFFCSSGKENKNTYYFSPYLCEHKKIFVEFVGQAFSEKIQEEEFTILGSGTSSLMTAMITLKSYGIRKLTAISPVYFSTVNLIEDLGMSFSVYQPSKFSNISFTIDDLKDTVTESGSQVILVTNPYFGSGIELGESDLLDIIELCNKEDMWLIVDGVYGGMNWCTKGSELLFDYGLLEKLKLSKRYILIESISKRLFLNGAKTAMLFSQPSFIEAVESCSLYTAGSLCYKQVELFRKIYDKENRRITERHIRKVIAKAKKSYSLIESLLIGSPIHLAECSSGYFALCVIPKHLDKDDMSIAEQILNDCGVLTIPHSRYFLKFTNYYSFRINLLSKKRDLIEGISKILSLNLPL